MGMAKANRQESVQEFQARMRSVGFLSKGCTKNKVSSTYRPINDPGVDAGKKAKVTVDELGTTITESDNRQDVNIVPTTYNCELNVMQG
jgi:hypothetical protein